MHQNVGEVMIASVSMSGENKKNGVKHISCPALLQSCYSLSFYCLTLLLASEPSFPFLCTSIHFSSARGGVVGGKGVCGKTLMAFTVHLSRRLRNKKKYNIHVRHQKSRSPIGGCEFRPWRYQGCCAVYHFVKSIWSQGYGRGCLQKSILQGHSSGSSLCFVRKYGLKNVHVELLLIL